MSIFTRVLQSCLFYLRSASFGLLALAFAGTSAQADEVSGQVVKLRGSATVIRQSLTAQIVLGTALMAGDKVATASDSRLKIQLADGSTLALGEDSELTISKLQYTAATKVRIIEVVLGTGIVRADAAKAAPGSRFSMMTNQAFSAVRGTEWIMIKEEDRTDICVLNGQVGVGLVNGPISAQTLGTNSWVPIDKSNVMPRPKKIPPEVLTAMLDATDMIEAEIPYNPAAAPALILQETAPATTQSQSTDAPKKKEKKKSFYPDRIGGGGGYSR